MTGWEDDYDNLSVGQQVCLYGSHCDEIAYLNVFYPFSVGRVAMGENEAEGGDSGGPWYYSKTAVGIHEGEYLVGFGFRDMWSSLAYLEDALGDVEVMTS